MEENGWSNDQIHGKVDRHKKCVGSPQLTTED